MDTISSVADLRQACQQWRNAGERIGLVMTMGNLHEGHIALVHEAAKTTDHVITTIFVNPMQFDREEDLKAYPRTLEQDSKMCEEAGVAILFTPSVKEIYPAPIDTVSQVHVPGFVDRLEGSSRPGHFVGVATVVNKVFNMVMPDVTVFGQKDIQQLLMIQKMVRDLNMPIEVIGLPTVRETDGLAMSSRNNYLNEQERATAPKFNQVLTEIVNRVTNGETDYRGLENQAMEELLSCGFGKDYVEICRIEDFQPAQAGDDNLIVVAAAWMGSARLIDNIQIPQ